MSKRKSIEATVHEFFSNAPIAVAESHIGVVRDIIRRRRAGEESVFATPTSSAKPRKKRTAKAKPPTTEVIGNAGGPGAGAAPLNSRLQP